MTFIKKLVLSLPKKNMIFDVGKGKYYSKRGKQSAYLISIKDPFIKEMNLGLKGRDNLNNLVHTLTQFMKEANKCNTCTFLLDENFSEDTGSIPQSLSYSGSETERRGGKNKGSDSKKESQPMVEEQKEKPRAQSLQEEPISVLRDR